MFILVFHNKNQCIFFHLPQYMMAFVSCDSVFHLMSILSDIGTAALALVWLMFTWNIFFHPLIFTAVMFLTVSVNLVD